MATVGSTLTTAFVIRELTGDERTLSLKTRALPYRPFELTGTQRNSVEWYPGSPIATMQVFGAKEEPTTINGQWKDVFLGAVGGTDIGSAPATVVGGSSGTTSIPDENGNPIETEQISVGLEVIRTARELVAIVDDMRRKGQEVEVTWLDQARRGIIDRFTVRWHTGHDCEWEIMFTWISQAESLSDVAATFPKTNLGELPNKVQAQLDKLAETSSASLLPQALSRASDAVAVLQEVSGKVQEYADQLTDAVVSMAGDITLYNEALRRVAGVLDGIKLAADDLVEVLEEVVDGIALDSGALSSINDTLRSFGQVLSTRATTRDQANAAIELRDLAAREQAALLAQISADMIRVFQARDGQDLREVSQIFYGTPDEWRGLMVFNHLTSSGLVAGQTVFVPAQPSTGDLC